MDFEEMKSVWDAQNRATAYKLDEQELHRRILARKKRAVFITNLSELMIICVYTAAGGFVLITAKMYYLAAWMFLVVIVLMISRIRRLRAARRFDRTVQGELQHALTTAKYQLRLSQLMRWNIAAIAALTLWALWTSGKPAWTLGLIFLIFLFSLYVSAFEHRKYKAQKESLEAMQQELDR